MYVYVYVYVYVYARDQQTTQKHRYDGVMYRNASLSIRYDMVHYSQKYEAFWLAHLNFKIHTEKVD